MCNKEQYDSHEKARVAAKGLSRHFRRSMSAYLCEECGVWHISTKGKKTKKWLWKHDKHKKYPEKILVKLGKKIFDFIVRG